MSSYSNLRDRNSVEPFDDGWTAPSSRSSSLDLPRPDLLQPAQPEDALPFSFGFCRELSFQTRKRLFYALFAVLAVGLIALSILSVWLLVTREPQRDHSSSPSSPTIRNVILMIGDGMGPQAITFGREFAAILQNKQHTSLTLDSHIVGTVKTWSNSNRVTDSAAAATAMACGIKTNNRMLAVDPHTEQPLRTVLEAAKEAGLRTGVVTTDALYGATPAGFTAHVRDRSMSQQIAEQQMKLQPDVMLGGGSPLYLSRLNITQHRYHVATSSEELTAMKELPLLGVFAPAQFTFQVDRQPDSTEPQLSQMAAKAISLLDNPKGFFLMIEGALIDVCEHFNDASCMFHEMLQFDAAASVVFDFAKRDGHTLVLATADHDCGGLALGHNYANGSYPVQNWFPEVLVQANASIHTMTLRIKAGGDIAAVVKEATGIQLSPEEVDTIATALTTSANAQGLLEGVIGRAVSYHALLGWSSIGHTAVDVNLYMQKPGPQSSNDLKGNIDNTDIAKFMAHTLNLHL